MIVQTGLANEGRVLSIAVIWQDSSMEWAAVPMGQLACDSDLYLPSWGL